LFWGVRGEIIKDYSKVNSLHLVREVIMENRQKRVWNSDVDKLSYKRSAENKMLGRRHMKRNLSSGLSERDYDLSKRE
jgi:hypothetical protein